MTDDEILRLVGKVCPSRKHVRIMSNQDLIEFAEAVAAKERDACAELCVSMRPSKQEFDERFYIACTLCAMFIRARGE